MLFVQQGRLATFVDKSKHNLLLVIVSIQDENFVIVQSPLTMDRQRVSLNTIKLLDIVLPIKDTMTKFEVQRIIDSEGAVMKYQQTEDYKKWEEIEGDRMCSDFERFKKELERSVKANLISEKMSSQ